MKWITFPQYRVFFPNSPAYCGKSTHLLHLLHLRLMENQQLRKAAPRKNPKNGQKPKRNFHGIFGQIFALRRKKPARRNGTAAKKGGGESRMSEDTMEVRRRVREAARFGTHCAGCGRPLQPDDAVWRMRIGLGYAWGRWRSQVAPFCKKHEPRWPCEVRSSGPCEGCGRMVHNTEGSIMRRRFHCSEACKARYQSALARERRASARGPSRACAECGEPFEPRRAAARFCCAACKQKAHRKRVTVSEGLPGKTFDSRNGGRATGRAGGRPGAIGARDAEPAAGY